MTGLISPLIQKWTGMSFFFFNTVNFANIINNYCDIYACITHGIYMCSVHFYKVFYFAVILSILLRLHYLCNDRGRRVFE